MYTIDVELFTLMTEFSYVIEVSPPKSLDIQQWWDSALKEMDDFWVFNLTEEGAFTENTSKYVKIMRQMLVDEAENRNLISTLA